MTRKRRKSSEIPAWERLTNKQKTLLENPPTPMTWVCLAKKEWGKCDTYNSGGNNRCFLCGADRPNSPKLLWPEYIAACNIVGITPRVEKFKISASRGPIVRSDGRWVEWVPGEQQVESITRNGKTRTRRVKRKS